MKKIILLILILITVSIAGNNKVINYKGEYLKYRVSFLGLTLGTIETSIYRDTIIDGKKIVIGGSYIKSSDGIPFVSLESDFKSFMNEKITHTTRFISNKIEDDGDLYQESIYDYDEGTLTFNEFKAEKKFNQKIVDIENKFNDGTSLFFFARKYSGIGRTIKVPTMIDTLPGVTIINFTQDEKEVEVDAIDYPVSTIYLDGEALWDGIYGLSGKFKGWFSNDEASIPIRAEMNVYVGSVVIELVEWKRGDWQPPKAK